MCRRGSRPRTFSSVGDVFVPHPLDVEVVACNSQDMVCELRELALVPVEVPDAPEMMVR